ncbi:SusC/RagA family TonB-linked outer membrane protein [Sediminitomix flava]|uniref:TonB-linked SusC/RagA family outer membrane protein n=1 Tax=Sediminitomix flava TaxID=379075 RepID=A0A315ZDM7_SEDFL|nr:SusC/RagA family TonB-linked outer membrane protein [Sediminitomix flava]PWJ42834.1 TonB-linked SusC/RagA family outer membrane protein [Sediminitomix flava]
MKRLLLLFSFLGMVFLGFSQERTVTGTVTDPSNNPIPGVGIIVKGSQLGVSTDINGQYKITLNEEGSTLIFRLVGFQTQEIAIGNQSVIDVKLAEDIEQLDEVVVTALGVSREKKSIGYATQQVDESALLVKDPTSVANSLQGKVAGVQIRSGSGGVGASSSVVIRGYTSLSGSNQPLYVVDGTPVSNYDQGAASGGYDFGNGAQDINPEDVESVSVLKGAAATALYGSRAKNGVIMITTKSGKSSKGLGIEINTGVTFDRVFIIPDLQNEYAGGDNMDYYSFQYDPSIHGPEWEKFNGAKTLNTGTDESWGPRMDGTPVLMWHSFVPESNTYNQLVPLLPQKDNYERLFDTGITKTNSIALSNSDEKSSYRLAFTNVSQDGVVPFSTLDRNTLSLKSKTEINKYFTAFASASYVKQETRRSGFGYSGSGTNIGSSFRVWSQRQIDPDILRKHTYSEALGQQVSWNMRNIADGRTYIRWSNNPYWALENIYATDQKDRIFGNAGLQFKLNEKFSVTATARTDYYSLQIQDQVGIEGTTTPSFGESKRISQENNFEILANYNDTFAEDWSVNVIAGGNIRTVAANSLGLSTTDGLVLDNYYHVRNTVNPEVGFFSSKYEEQINSIFTSASIGYKDFLFLDASHRIDWSSTLPPDDNSFGYSALSTSFVFSELLASQDVLSFGKLRAGIGQAGAGTGAYSLYNTYSTGAYGSANIFAVPNTLPNSELKNELATEYEIGLETQLFNGRIGLEATYFNKISENQILDVSVPSTSGYSTAIINAGEIQTDGVELVISATPLKIGDFQWDMIFNYAKVKSIVNELDGDLDTYRISSVGSGWVSAEAGGSYGDMYAYQGYVYDDAGNKVVDDNGLYERSGEPVNLGSAIPESNGGFINTFRYKGFSLGAQIDFSTGGLVYSFMDRWGTKAGQTARTVGINANGKNYRDPVEEGGGILSEGVRANGEVNTQYVSAPAYFNRMRYLPEEFIYDASYVKLREVKLSYNIPSKLLSNIGLNAATLSVVGRNLALLKSNTPGFDPEVNSTTTNAIGYESGQAPSTRSIGFNLNVRF